MDRKNTMLLTVIAVATLLVAVVGATFAYFSISGTNNSGTTVVTTQTGSVGTVTLTSPNTSLKLNLAASDMAENLGGTVSYYSVLSSSTDNYQTTDSGALQQVLLATVVDTNTETEYKCTGSVKVVLASSKTGSTALANLVDGDGELVFGGVLAGTTKKLTEIKTTDAGTGNVTYETTIDNVLFEGLKSGVDKDVTAYLKINNTTAAQDYLQGENLTVSITAPTFACEVVNNS